MVFIASLFWIFLFALVVAIIAVGTCFVLFASNARGSFAGSNKYFVAYAISVVSMMLFGLASLISGIMKLVLYLQNSGNI